MTSVFRFPETNSMEWVDTCSKWITWLLRVHITLQLMLLTESTAKCKSCIIPLISSTLDHYLGPQSSIKDVVNPRTITSQSYTTSVNTSDISDLLSR